MTKEAAVAAPKQAPSEEAGKKNKAEAGSPSPAAPASSSSKPHSAPLPAVAAAASWLPFRVAHSKALGWHALAARDIKAGELLLVERHVAAVPRTEHRSRACPACAGGVCGGRGRPCSPACALRAAAIGERAAPALAAIEEASRRHGLPRSCFEGLGSEDLGDLWTLVASLVAAAAIEAEAAAARGTGGGEGREEEEEEEEEKQEHKGGEKDSCGHDHGPNPEADSALDNAESSRSAAALSSSSPAPATRWPLSCSVLSDVPFLLDGWDRYKQSWRAQATGMAKEVHAALAKAEKERSEGGKSGESNRGESGGGDDANKKKKGSFFLPSNGAFAKPLDLARLSCLVATNAHGTGAGNPASVDFGFGLFPALAAAFNHSCEPTTNFCAAGGFMRARALRDIKAGEQLTVSYVNLFEPRRTRAHQLMEAKHFVCRCPRCSVPLLRARDRFLDGVVCREKGCKGGTLIPLGKEADGAPGGGGGKKKKKKKTAGEGAGAAASEEEAKASGDGATEEGEEGEEEEEEQRQQDKDEEEEGGSREASSSCSRLGEPPWTCDTCGASVEARSPDGKGPADVCDAAASMWSRAAASARAAGGGGGHSESSSSSTSRAAAAAAAPLFGAVVSLSPKTLHPHHVLVFDSLMPLCNGLRAAGDTAGAARAVGSLIQAMDSLVGVPSSELGNLLQLHAELLAERCSGGGGDSSKGGAAGALSSRLARSARESAARAAEVRRVTLGERNPLTREAEALVESLKALK